MSPCLTWSPSLHAELSDDAAGRVLDLLDVGIDDDGALRDERSGQRHGSRPAADAAGQHDDDHQSGQHVAADGLARVPLGFCVLGCRVHDFTAPASGTTLSARDAAAPSRCSTRASTSSFGPKAWTRP